MSIAELDHRCRELFPLPLPSSSTTSGAGEVVLGRRAEKFRKRSTVAVGRALEAVESLNGLIRDTGLVGEGTPTAGGFQAADRKQSIVDKFSAGYDPACAAKDSVASLLESSLTYNGEEAECQHVGSYNRDLLALPSSNVPPMDIIHMVDADAHRYVKEFEDLILRSPDKLHGIDAPSPYWDPKLRHSRRQYVDFVVRLAERSIVGFAQKPKNEVGCFFVKKKDGRLRLIVDARSTNVLCEEPPGM